MKDGYTTLKDIGEASFTEKKSEFIGSAMPVQTEEEALEFIDDDELVEVVPDDIRIRKKLLKELERRRNRKID